GFSGQFAFAVAGAISVLVVIFASSRRSAFAPERVLLAGIALSAMVDAVVGVLSSTGDPRAVLLMRWTSGSTYLPIRRGGHETDTSRTATQSFRFSMDN
uniref:iron chelate uptake ABC transporter family permease subunit n=1 Tax=Rhizobium ecuadorense TaxID=1671795 RepID=UPI000B32A2C3